MNSVSYFYNKTLSTVGVCAQSYYIFISVQIRLTDSKENQMKLMLLSIGGITGWKTPPHLSDAVGDEPNHEDPRAHLHPGDDHGGPHDACSAAGEKSQSSQPPTRRLINALNLSTSQTKSSRT